VPRPVDDCDRHCTPNTPRRATHRPAMLRTAHAGAPSRRARGTAQRAGTIRDHARISQGNRPQANAIRPRARSPARLRSASWRRPRPRARYPPASPLGEPVQCPTTRAVRPQRCSSAAVRSAPVQWPTTGAVRPRCCSSAAGPLSESVQCPTTGAVRPRRCSSAAVRSAPVQCQPWRCSITAL
jgi:hypothetical protein